VRKSIHTPKQKRLLLLLRELRLEAGLTQAELGSRIQKDQTFISKYESGERRLDILEVRELCRALGVPLTEFVRRLENDLK
jgi:transcriptional regulator with XRE-family HTH domain